MKETTVKLKEEQIMGIKIKIFAYTGEENISLVDRFFEIVQSFSNTFKEDVTIVKEELSLKDTLVAGAEEPESILFEAEGWNECLNKKVIENFRKIEKTAEKVGFEKLSDYFENVFRTGQRTPESWYLWSSMRNMDDIFGYGSDHAVCDKNGNWTIMMPEEVKKEVKKHPEQYAVIKLIYD